MNWHTLTTERTLRETASSPEGVTTAEAAARRAASGPNRLPESTRLSPARLFLVQFTDLLIVVLLAAAAVSAALGEIVDAVTQLFNALAVRSERRSLSAVGLFTNPAMTAAVAVSVLLQLAALYLPALNVALRTEPLTGAELAAAAAVSSLILAAAEGVKAVRRRRG